MLGFPGGSEGKASARNAGGLGSIPGSGRSPGEGNGNPLQYSSLEKPMDGGGWWATVQNLAPQNQQFEQDQKYKIEMASLDHFSEMGSFLGGLLEFSSLLL